MNNISELTEQAQTTSNHLNDEDSAKILKYKEVKLDLERMQRKYSLLQTELEALRKSLDISQHWTWIWFIASAVLLSIVLKILSDWIAA